MTNIKNITNKNCTCKNKKRENYLLQYNTESFGIEHTVYCIMCKNSKRIFISVREIEKQKIIINKFVFKFCRIVLYP